MNRVVRASGSKPDSAKRRQLELAIAVGEEREHEERQPVAGLFVERRENARVVDVARPALQQRLTLLAPLAPEETMEQVHHRPQVPAFLDVHLKEVPEVVERRTGGAEQPLLLDRRRLRVALRHDEALQRRTVFTRHFLPGGLSLVSAEVDPRPRREARGRCPSGSRAS